MSSKEDFLFSKSGSRSVTVEQLDQLMNYCLDPKTGRFSWIVHCIKLVAVFAYIYTRKQIVDEDWKYSKQRNQLRRIKNNRSIVEEDI